MVAIPLRWSKNLRKDFLLSSPDFSTRADRLRRLQLDNRFPSLLTSDNDAIYCLNPSA